jgi:hypothetical protein
MRSQNPPLQSIGTARSQSADDGVHDLPADALLGGGDRVELHDVGFRIHEQLDACDPPGTDRDDRILLPVSRQPVRCALSAREELDDAQRRYRCQRYREVLVDRLDTVQRPGLADALSVDKAPWSWHRRLCS